MWELGRPNMSDLCLLTIATSTERHGNRTEVTLPTVAATEEPTHRLRVGRSGGRRGKGKNLLSSLCLWRLGFEKNVVSTGSRFVSYLAWSERVDLRSLDSPVAPVPGGTPTF